MMFYNITVKDGGIMNMNFTRDNPIVEYLETLIEEESNDEKSFPIETDTEKK